MKLHATTSPADAINLHRAALLAAIGAGFSAKEALAAARDAAEAQDKFSADVIREATIEKVKQDVGYAMAELMNRRTEMGDLDRGRVSLSWVREADPLAVEERGITNRLHCVVTVDPEISTLGYTEDYKQAIREAAMIGGGVSYRDFCPYTNRANAYEFFVYVDWTPQETPAPVATQEAA